MKTEAYISGFVDGEGCFCVSFNRSKRHKFGWDIRPSFSVSQNRNRSRVLTIMKDHFSCGAIRPDRSDSTLKYEIRSVSDLVDKIIPHFMKFPLLSEKQKEVEIFSRICRMMYERKHLTEEGFEKVKRLSSMLNTNGKKKYLRREIKI